MRAFKELDVVTYGEQTGTIVHLYKHTQTAIVEFGNEGDLKDVALNKLTLHTSIEENNSHENNDSESDDLRGTV